MNVALTRLSAAADALARRLRLLPQTGDAPLRHWTETAGVLYLTSPVFLFFLFFARRAVALPALLLMALAFWQLVKRTEWVSPLKASRATWVLLGIATLWIVSAGGFGLLYQNLDWGKHYAIVNFLTKHSWPAYNDSHSHALRYVLGWYLVPMLFIKALGGMGTNTFLSLWSLLGVFLVFRQQSEFFTGRKAFLAAPLVFIFFSGLDAVGTVFTGFIVNPWQLMHIEWWAGWIEYSSNTTSLFWVPQHAIPGWIFVLLLMHQSDRPTLLPFLGLAGTALLFWSPFTALGVFPFLLLVCWQKRALWRDYLVPAVAFGLVVGLPILIFLASGAEGLPHSFIWQHLCQWPETYAPCFRWRNAALFVLLEVLVLAAPLFFRERRYLAWLLVATGFLVLLPLYRVGAFNDLAMRGSAPALAVLAILAARMICTTTGWPRRFLLAFLAIGAITPLCEMYRGVTRKPEDITGIAFREDLEFMGPHNLGNLKNQYFAPAPVPILRRR